VNDMLPVRSILPENIIDLLSSRLGLQIPSAETDLFEAGIMDSMSFVELLVQLENNFGIRLALGEIEFENFRCVNKIAEFVASRASQRSLIGE
jgi:D-alanine--poly(phosphoribitol) ligase subunit 2